MRLLKLSLSNFKGITSFEISPNGHDITIYGDNATGKTTLADAFYWLLFDKDSQNRKDFEIKSLGADGQPMHNLDHAVFAEIMLPSGDTLTLRKTYREQWTKRRGSASAEFTGHTTDYAVNGVPVQKKDYDGWIASIADEKLFRLLTDPTHFNTSLHWQERRRILLEVCGDVSDADVIASSPDLADLPAILGRHSLDDYRKILRSRRTEINKALDVLPARIDELMRSSAAADDTPIDTTGISELLRELREQRARIVAGGEAAELTKRVRELEAEKQRFENDAKRATYAVIDEVQQRERVQAERVRSVEVDLEAKRRSLRALQTELASLEPKLETLRNEYQAISARSFKFAGEDICAACGQRLPADRVAEASRKAEEEFNAKKARLLEANAEEGKRLRQRMEDLASEIERIEAQILDTEDVLGNRRVELIAIQQSVAEAKAAAETHTPESEELAAIEREIHDLSERISSLRESGSTELARVDAEIRDHEQRLKEALEHNARIEAARSARVRVEELAEEQKGLAEAFEKTERELYLCDLFVRSKVSLLTERINSRFTLAKFKLFDELVNGGIEECCEVTVSGVPYGSLNHGARLNVGLDIINTLAEHHSFAPPIVIDNAESVTSIMPTLGQQIRLVVSAHDRELRVESKSPALASA